MPRVDRMATEHSADTSAIRHTESGDVVEGYQTLLPLLKAAELADRNRLLDEGCGSLEQVRASSTPLEPA